MRGIDEKGGLKRPPYNLIYGCSQDIRQHQLTQ